MADGYDVLRKKFRRVHDPWYERLMWELPNLADGRKPELSVICQYPEWTNPGDGCTMFKGVLCPRINPETDEPKPPPTEEELEPVVFFKLVMKGTFAAENEHRAYKRMRRNEDNWPDRNVHKLIDELQVTNKHKTMVAHVKFRCFVLELVPYTMADFCDQVLAKSTIPPWETQRVDQLRLNISQGLFMQLLCGLNYLHRQDILHGNIRPECILLDDSALHLKISDFSQAQLLTYWPWQGELREPSKLQVIQGTYGYKAPEVIAEDRSSYDLKTDMFSAGCVLADMVLGKWCIFKKMNSEKIREGDKLRQLKVMKKCLEDIPSINLAIDRNDFGILVSRLLDFDQGERPSASEAYHSKFFRMLDPESRKVRRRVKKFKLEKRISVENIPMVLYTARSTRLVSALNIDNPINKFVPTATIPLEPVEYMHRRTDLDYEIVGAKLANPDIGEHMRLRKAQQERLREERHEERERLLTKEKERKARVRFAKVRAERELEELLAKRRSQKEVDDLKELAEQVQQRDAEKAAAKAAKEAEQGEKEAGEGKEKEPDKEAVGGEEVVKDKELVAPKEAGALERVTKDLEEGTTGMDEKTEAKLEEKKAEGLKEETKLEERGGKMPSSDKPQPTKGSSATGKKTEVLSGAGKRKFLPSFGVWQPAQKKGEKKDGERESPRKVQFATQVQKTAAPKPKEPGSPRKPPTARASAQSTASTPKEATPRLPPVKKPATGSQHASAKKPSSAQGLSTSRPKLSSWRQKRHVEEAAQVTPRKKGTWRLEDSIVSPRLKKKQVPEKEPDLWTKCQQLLAKSAELDRTSAELDRTSAELARRSAELARTSAGQGAASGSSTKQLVEFTDISSLPEWKSPSPPSSPRDRKSSMKSAAARSLPKQPSAAKRQRLGRTSSSRYSQRDPKLAGKKAAPQRLTGKPPSAKNLSTIPESKSPLSPEEKEHSKEKGGQERSDAQNVENKADPEQEHAQAEGEREKEEEGEFDEKEGGNSDAAEEEEAGVEEETEKGRD